MNSSKAAHGSLRPSLVSELLGTPRNNNELEEAAFQDAVKWTAGSMYGGMSFHPFY